MSRGSPTLLRLGGSVLGILAVAILLVFVASERSLSRSFDVPREWVAPATRASSEVLERGRHVATVIAQCQFCHGSDLGGREIADDPLIGRIDSSNLTRGQGGIASDFSDADWERAIRFGLRRDGRSLLLMPSRHLAALSDGDLDSLIAYLRAVPPVDRIPRPVRIGFLTRVVVAVGAADDLFSATDVSAQRPVMAPVRPAATPEYGRYLVEIGNCRVCHHADLQGGLHPLALPGEPPPPSLRGATAMQGWSLQDFAQAMQRGRTPDGRVLDREYMPWPSFAGLSEVELEALWRYLREEQIGMN